MTVHGPGYTEKSPGNSLLRRALAALSGNASGPRNSPPPPPPPRLQGVNKMISFDRARTSFDKLRMSGMAGRIPVLLIPALALLAVAAIAGLLWLLPGDSAQAQDEQAAPPSPAAQPSRPPRPAATPTARTRPSPSP